MSQKPWNTAKMFYKGAVIVAALMLVVPAGSATATHRRPERVDSSSTVNLRVHEGSGGANANGGTRAWTPNVGPFVLASGPSRAAVKIAHLKVGDTLVIVGQLAGTYTVVGDGLDARRDHDLCVQVVGANAVVARFNLERIL